ncbi:MAG: phosphomannomutase, partial [Paracoccaceae bacterium]
PKATIAKIVDTYAPKATHRDDTDGISLSFGDWRFNLRSSNTEPVVRLNIEARGNRDMVQQKLTELRDLINGS